jgi:hypothetical protein
MGIEYYLYNHENCSIYELGKSFYFDIDKDFEYLTEEELFIDLINNDYHHEYDSEYLKLICKDLIKFIGSTDKSKIELISDGGDDLGLARSIGYKCVGSRYSLGNDIENKNAVDYINNMSTYDLDKEDIRYIEEHGWNLERYSPK